MWTVLDSHSLLAVYAFVILAPFIASYLIGKLITWWR
ncbi:hypothetical protein CEB3_c17720 [Peptococcaceae bacterium CEB3]|nr:hypothetical protein CEB3_c17720 [Peptococcaceae bacterium CEB3]